MQFRSPVASLRHRSAVEWPTCFLALGIYLCWGLLTFFHGFIPWPLLVVGGGWIVAWQMSLQHEVMHGHPTRYRWLNDAIGLPPLTLWLPYPIYRRSHLRHHRNAHLTDPLEDPESYYLTPERFGRLGSAARAFLRFRNTFLGRITFGAVRSIVLFLWSELHNALRGDRATLRIWVPHLLGVSLLFGWVWGICGMSPLVYVLCFVLPSRSLSQIRSFAEHRAADVQDERTAIVENSSILSLLFLNNNLHVVHHDKPALPWYRIPAYYRAHRARIIEANGGLVYDGYGDVIRRYFLTPHHDGAHPGHQAPRVSVPLPAPRLAHTVLLSQASVEYPIAAASSSKAATVA